MNDNVNDVNVDEKLEKSNGETHVVELSKENELPKVDKVPKDSEFLMPSLPVSSTKVKHAEEKIEKNNVETQDLEKENIDQQQNNIVELSKENELPKEDKVPKNSEFLMPSLPVCSTKVKHAEEKPIKTDSEIKTSSSKIDLPYNKPSWGGPADNTSQYCLTILKDGIVRGNVDLCEKDIVTFGRLDSCDVVVEHPSCSRYHALLQYCVEEKDKRKKGFYLYDLGSTHGTYLNKIRVKPKVFNRIRVGYQMKFGGSTRLYIVEGPEDDQEEEIAIDDFRKKKQQYVEQKSAEKQKRKPIKGIIQKAGSDKTKDEVEGEKDDEQVEGASWGFGEDAQEEGINLQDLLERRKDFEVKDPKKTLRSFFEREGLEFEYEMSANESGISVTHIAKVALPLDTVDGTEVIAEGRSSNKKDAVMACATDACRLLQAYDAMQNTPREDQALKRRKQLEENDFYESDDDEFLDRTGAIEKKRLTRKKWAGRDENIKTEIDTYETLQKKQVQKEKELQEIQAKLELAKQTPGYDDTDSLDAYMMSMKHSLDKTTTMKLKRQKIELTQEIKKINRLIEKVKPTELPSIVIKETKVPDLDQSSVISTVNLKRTLPTPSSNTEESSKLMSSDIKTNSTKENPNLMPTDMEANNTEKQERKSHIENKTPNQDFTILEPPSKKSKKKVYKVEAKPTSSNDTSSEDYVGWLPPKGQTGDGRTSLNDKFGY